MTEYRFHGANLIGAERSSRGRSTYCGVDPAAGADLPGSFHEATEEEIDQALTAADEAFAVHQEVDAEQRSVLLDQIADEIDALGDVLVERVVAETALGEGRVRGERGRTTAQLRLFASLVREGSWVDARIDPGMPDRTPTPRPDLRRMLIPVGPVAVFGASNFPLAFSVAGGDTASALAAGCPVIVKAHPAHPGTSELVAEAVKRAVEKVEIHPGTFSMLHGREPSTSLSLVRHPLLHAVGFTGSLHAGRAIFDAAAAREVPIPVFAEMGSTNPIFLLPGALSAGGSNLAENLVGSVTLGAGQFCTNPGVVVGVEHPDLDAFVETVASKLALTPTFTMLYDGICRAFEDGVEAIAKIPGVGIRGRATATAGSAGAAVLETDAATYLCERRLREEVFGPSTLVVRCRDAGEMERIAGGLEGNLTASLHGTAEDLAKAGRLVQLLQRRVGRLLFNGFPTGVEVGSAMQHGGPYPATTDARSTSVGTAAVYRFARPICYQGFPADALPVELQDANPRGLWRLVDGERTQAAIG